MSTKTRKTKEELYEEAKAEYLVPVNLQLTLSQANALYRAVVRAMVDDNEPELLKNLPAGLSEHLHDAMYHAYGYCSDLALKRHSIGQE